MAVSGLWYFLNLFFPQFLQQPMKINKETVLTPPPQQIHTQVLLIWVPISSGHPSNNIIKSQLLNKKVAKAYFGAEERGNTTPRGLWGTGCRRRPDSGVPHLISCSILKACAAGEAAHTCVTRVWQMTHKHYPLLNHFSSALCVHQQISVCKSL